MRTYVGLFVTPWHIAQECAVANELNTRNIMRMSNHTCMRIPRNGRDHVVATQPKWPAIEEGEGEGERNWQRGESCSNLPDASIATQPRTPAADIAGGAVCAQLA